MNRLSILLVENQISVTADIVTTIGEHLETYALHITRNITEATADPEPVDIICVNVVQLTGNRLDNNS